MKKWKVKELREHLVQYDIHRNSAIKNKTELLQELLKIVQKLDVFRPVQFWAPANFPELTCLENPPQKNFPN